MCVLRQANAYCYGGAWRIAVYYVSDLILMGNIFKYFFQNPYHCQDCSWDGTTCILRKGNHHAPVETRSRSRENRPPWKNHQECSGSPACSLRRPLPHLRAQGLRSQREGRYRRQIFPRDGSTCLPEKDSRCC